MDTQRIADRALAFRTARGLSQEAFGELFGMSGAYVSRIENLQVKEPRRSDLIRMAEAMGISVPDLTGEADDALVERLAEYESDPEMRVFLAGLAGKIRAHDP